VKAGDVLTYTSWFDNSANNPANPDPSKTVRWGLQTFQEMHLGYFEYYVPGDKPGEGRSLRNVTARKQLEATFNRLDRNRDGFVTEEEAPQLWGAVKAADTNGDGRISLDEALKRFGGS
jgi:hypothetical protein